MTEAATSKLAAGFPEQIRTRAKVNSQNGTRRTLEKNSSAELREAIRSYEKLRESSSVGTAPALLAALEACSRLKDLEAGMKVHSLAAETGDDLNTGASEGLVQMYVRCGSLADALQVFEKASQVSVVSWNALVSGYLEAGDFVSALEMFSRMQEENSKPNAHTFIAALKACSGLADQEQGTRVSSGELVKLRCLEKGLALYSLATRNNYDQELAVANTMIHMFSKCGGIAEARHVFERLRSRSPVSWNALMFGYVEAGEPESSLRIFQRMLDESQRPNALNFVAALKACASLAMSEEQAKLGDEALKVRSLEAGMAVHSLAERSGHSLDDFLANTAVDMYSKCGSLLDALRAFDAMKSRSIVSWNTLISGFVENGESQKALHLFKLLRRDESLKPNSRTFVAALSACASSAASEQGKRVEGRILKVESLKMGRSIHSEARKSGVEMELHVANTLVHMYSKCGSLGEAREVFERIAVRDLVSYNVLMFAYAESGDGGAALEMYSRMKEQKLKPGSLTYVAALKALASCGSREDDAGRARYLDLGRKIHSEVVRSGFESDVLVASTLLDMYSKCRNMANARRVFERMKIHDVVSWNAMIFGYEQSGEPELGVEFYDRMRDAGVKPDAVSFTAVLKSCSSCAEKEVGEKKMKWLEKGREIHSDAEKTGFEMDLFLASTLVDLYSKSGRLSEARGVFDRMERHDVVAWNSLISGYAESGENESCLELFELMVRSGDEGVQPNAQTYAAVLKACGSSSALDTGKEIHRRICREGWEEELVVSGSLVDFYGKCGRMPDSEIVFGSMRSFDELVTWNALLSGYAHQANSEGVFRVFRSMILEEKIHPNGITFLGALKACSHAGLVSRGKKIFRLMADDAFRIAPGIKHYTCMVDMLGRSNRLDEALKLVSNMEKIQPDASIWMTILAAAKKWKNVGVGMIAFESLVSLNPGETAAYVVMGNIYAEAGMWEEKAAIRSRAGAPDRSPRSHEP